MGWALVVDEPLERADIIVLPQWAAAAGAIDAADLIQRGLANRVAVLPEPPRPADMELRRRGLTHPDEAADLIELMRSLGVTETHRISTPAGGTAAEGEVLSTWCDQQQFRSIIVISSPDHSRRLRRVLRRSFQGHPPKVMIRAARYAPFDPDRWWETRDNVRTALVELQKLLLDVARHPIS